MRLWPICLFSCQSGRLIPPRGTLSHPGSRDPAMWTDSLERQSRRKRGGKPRRRAETDKGNLPKVNTKACCCHPEALINHGPKLSPVTACKDAVARCKRAHGTRRGGEDQRRLTLAASLAMWKSVISLKVFLKRCYLGFHPGVTQFIGDGAQASAALLLAALYKRLAFASLDSRAANVQHATPLVFYHLLRLSALTLSARVRTLFLHHLFSRVLFLFSFSLSIS